MKQNIKVLLLVLAVTGICMSCKNTYTGRADIDDEGLITENPATIVWKGDRDAEIESFQADVAVYVKNNRKGTGAVPTNNYRIAQKTIDGITYTRLDFGADEDGALRSIVSNETEMVYFDPDAEKVQFRLDTSGTVHPDLAFLNTENMISKINLSKIRNEAKRLSFDIAEDNSERFEFALPSRYFTDEQTQRISTKAVFDTANEVLEQVEIVNMIEDGTIITTTSVPLYQEKDGVPVKIGMVSTIDSKAPGLIEGIEDAPVYESYDDIPTISSEEVKELEEAGLLFPSDDVLLGNPADLSYIETVIEVYSDIEINAVPDAAFKLIRGGK
jgi:hypothetical protein